MSATQRELEGRSVTVMGLGLYGGGAAVTRFLLRRGARVTVTDLRTEQVLAPALRELEGARARFVLGRHEQRDFAEAQLVVVNPAVPRSSPLLAIARAAGAELTSEVALLLDHTPARVVAITGTQGKSSTTNHLAQLLAAALRGRRVFLGGNIGHSLLDDLEHMSADDVCALELSSYQLECLPEDMRRARAESPIDVAVITNVLADHLERHGTRAEYARAKLRLLELVAPGGAVLLPAGDFPAGDFPAGDLPAGDFPSAAEVPADVQRFEHPGPAFARDEQGYRFDGRRLASRAHDGRFVAFQRDNLHLALAAARLMGAQPEALDAALGSLRGLPHRLDPVGRLAGRCLWDNAISTAPDSTISALEALPRELVVMLGGQVKDVELAPLIDAVREREARVVIFGAARAQWPALFRAADVPVREAAGAREALTAALEFEGGDLLFSPACASFDAYPNVIARALDVLDAARALGLTALEQGALEGASRGEVRA